MTNYQNDIMESLVGDTPKQKYEYLQMLLKNHIEHTYVINRGFENLFMNASYFVTETGATISVNDYNCLSDDQKQKCNPIYK
jgi:hypothetical protein